MIYDTAIILCHKLKAGRELSKESRERVDAGIEKYLQKEVASLIMSGGYCYELPFSVAECMEEYALKRGMPKEKIILEDVSLDTIGQLIFCKEGIIDPRGFRKILIVTHDWHMTKTEVMSYFVFDKKYDLGFLRINPQDSKKKGEDISKIRGFLETIGKDVPINNSFLELLLKKHPWYNGKHPHNKNNGDFFRKEMERLIKENSK